MTLALGLFLLGLHFVFYLYEIEMYAMSLFLGYTVGAIRIALLPISLGTLGIGCMRAEVGDVTKIALLALLFAVGVFAYLAPYLSYAPYAMDDPRMPFLAKRFDLWTFCLGSLLCTASCAHLWMKCFRR